jgi:hypothetical protein
MPARVAKWQTQQTQNLPGRKPRVGSTPTSGTRFARLRRALSVIGYQFSAIIGNRQLTTDN